MPTFLTTKNAKEFLISRIITEAQLENVSLSDIEKKMLYFSESGCTLPDIDRVSEAFDRDYNQEQYETKIGKIIQNFRARASRENKQDLDTFEKAAAIPRKEDHYLLILIDAPDHLTASSSGSRFLKLVVIGFALACTIFLVAYLCIRLF